MCGEGGGEGEGGARAGEPVYPAECYPVLQHLCHSVHRLCQGEVRGGLHQDMQNSHEGKNIQPHHKGVQETSGQGLPPIPIISKLNHNTLST